MHLRIVIKEMFYRRLPREGEIFVALLCSEATAITKFDRNLSIWIVFAILEICYQMILEQYLAHSTE